MNKTVRNINCDPRDMAKLLENPKDRRSNQNNLFQEKV